MRVIFDRYHSGNRRVNNLKKKKKRKNKRKKKDKNRFRYLFQSDRNYIVNLTTSGAASTLRLWFQFVKTFLEMNSERTMLT